LESNAISILLLVGTLSVLFSTTLAYADTVQIDMAKGSATNQKCGDQCFIPSTISIAVGTTVGWKNTDTVAHTATATDGSFDTSLVNPSITSSITFNNAGTYQYVCILHPWAKGTVIVGDPSVPLTPTTPIDTSITFVIDADPRITVNVDKDKYLAGDIITISGSGYPNAQTITISILGSIKNKISELTLSTTNSGTFQTIWAIPADMKSGQYVIQISPPVYPPSSQEVPARLVITGKIDLSYWTNNNQVTVALAQTFDNGKTSSIIRVTQVQPQPDGSFEYDFYAVYSGDYKIIANYGPTKVETMFTVDGKSTEIPITLPILQRPVETKKGSPVDDTPIKSEQQPSTPKPQVIPKSTFELVIIYSTVTAEEDSALAEYNKAKNYFNLKPLLLQSSDPKTLLLDIQSDLRNQHNKNSQEFNNIKRYNPDGTPSAEYLKLWMKNYVTYRFSSDCVDTLLYYMDQGMTLQTAIAQIDSQMQQIADDYTSTKKQADAKIKQKVTQKEVPSKAQKEPDQKKIVTEKKKPEEQKSKKTKEQLAKEKTDKLKKAKELAKKKASEKAKQKAKSK
jgi:plastocyanin